MTEEQIDEALEWAVLACKEAENGAMEEAAANLERLKRALMEAAGLAPPLGGS